MTEQHDVFTRAIAFAAEAHEDQVRKGTTIPYIVHPMEAAAICSYMTDDPEILAAAVLHDVVEDADVTADEIERGFGPRVAKLVASESEDKRADRPAAETWRERKQKTIDHLLATNDVASLMICLGDKLSNIRSISRDLEANGDRLWDRFNQKDPLQHAWYYQSIADALKPKLGDTAAWREYQALVSRTFARYTPTA